MMSWLMVFLVVVPLWPGGICSTSWWWQHVLRIWRLKIGPLMAWVAEVCWAYSFISTPSRPYEWVAVAIVSNLCCKVAMKTSSTLVHGINLAPRKLYPVFFWYYPPFWCIVSFWSPRNLNLHVSMNITWDFKVCILSVSWTAARFSYGLEAVEALVTALSFLFIFFQLRAKN